MKIIYFGTADFAIPTLEALFLRGHQILGVVTAADKRKGRGQQIGVSPVKLFAQKKGLTVFQPQRLKDAKFIRVLKSNPVDLFVVASYGKILTEEILNLPKIYAINLHASLLPKYRGAAPVNWAIIRGEKESGITVFKMNELMDQGEIILQRKTNISSSDTAISLNERLSKIGAEAVLEVVDAIEHNSVIFSKQDEKKRSLAPKLKKKDGLINWNCSALEIHNRIRGLQPWPGAFTYFENKFLKIWQSQVVSEGKKCATPAEIVELDKKRGILVQTGGGKLLISALQLEGKKRMTSVEFILGHNIQVGMKMKGERNG